MSALAPLSACGAASATPTPAVKPVATPAQTPAQCPRTAPARVEPNTWAPARARLAPRGARAVRLCRYSGMNAHPALRLTRSALVDRPAGVAALIRGFDRLPAVRGTLSCPLDDDSQILALLAYPGAHHVTIAVHLRGCNQVSNGDLTRSALGTPGQPGPALIARLERLTS